MLVAGKHGSLVDTMIFTNIDPVRQKVTMISIPRDLYYNNRKINSIYHYYGMDELKRALSFVTGYEVDKYILIDMYAFIEVVDMIGGIDVHLPEPVVDPTYKTFDGGKWGTMYYRAGDHHLSGKQALRLARSRHTSSDFARSERQHMILEAIREKGRNLGLADAAGLQELGNRILEKTETDISLAEAVSYFFRYQNYEINRGHVLSSGNVLFSQHTGDGALAEAGCTGGGELSEGQAATCAGIDKGAYILLPHNENWNVVRWYVQSIIDGEEE